VLWTAGRKPRGPGPRGRRALAVRTPGQSAPGREIVHRYAARRCPAPKPATGVGAGTAHDHLNHEGRGIGPGRASDRRRARIAPAWGSWPLLLVLWLSGPGRLAGVRCRCFPWPERRRRPCRPWSATEFSGQLAVATAQTRDSAPRSNGSQQGRGQRGLLLARRPLGVGWARACISMGAATADGSRADGTRSDGERRARPIGEGSWVFEPAATRALTLNCCSAWPRSVGGRRLSRSIPSARPGANLLAIRLAGWIYGRVPTQKRRPSGCPGSSSLRRGAAADETAYLRSGRFGLSGVWRALASQPGAAGFLLRPKTQSVPAHHGASAAGRPTHELQTPVSASWTGGDDIAFEGGPTEPRIEGGSKARAAIPGGTGSWWWRGRIWPCRAASGVRARRAPSGCRKRIPARRRPSGAAAPIGGHGAAGAEPALGHRAGVSRHWPAWGLTPGARNVPVFVPRFHRLGRRGRGEQADASGGPRSLVPESCIPESRSRPPTYSRPPELTRKFPPHHNTRRFLGRDPAMIARSWYEPRYPAVAAAASTGWTCAPGGGRARLSGTGPPCVIRGVLDAACGPRRRVAARVPGGMERALWRPRA